eukprot:GHVH01016452.1.p1 GENE.GHVH01016452.1~~GHVH01016452.1.p1  ORF type:complete len:636 (+),score=77.33 GHVH01016452.1:109-2016(+)
MDLVVSEDRENKNPADYNLLKDSLGVQALLNDLWIAGTLGINLSLRQKYDASFTNKGNKTSSRLNIEDLSSRVIQASDTMVNMTGAWILGIVKLYHSAWKSYETSAQRLFTKILNSGIKAVKRKRNPNSKASRRDRVSKMLTLNMEAALTDMSVSEGGSLVMPSLLPPDTLLEEIPIDGTSSEIESVHTWAHSDIDILLAGSNDSKRFDTASDSVEPRRDALQPPHEFALIDSLGLDMASLLATSMNDPEILPLDFPNAPESLLVGTHSDLASSPALPRPTVVRSSAARSIPRVKTIALDNVITEGDGLWRSKIRTAKWYGHGDKVPQLVTERCTANQWMNGVMNDAPFRHCRIQRRRGQEMSRLSFSSQCGRVAMISGWLADHLSEFQHYYSSYEEVEIEKVRGVRSVTVQQPMRHTTDERMADMRLREEHSFSVSPGLTHSDLLSSPGVHYPEPDKRRGVDVDVPASFAAPEDPIQDREFELGMSDSGLTSSEHSAMSDSELPSDQEMLSEGHSESGAASSSFTMKTFKVKRQIDAIFKKREAAASLNGGDTRPRPLYFHEISRGQRVRKAPLMWQILTLATSGDIELEQSEPYGNIELKPGLYNDLSLVEQENYTQLYNGMTFASDPTQKDS